MVGAFAAYLARIPRLAHVLRQPVVGLLLLGIVWLVFFGEVSSRVQAALVSVAFCEVACGKHGFRAALQPGCRVDGRHQLRDICCTDLFCRGFSCLCLASNRRQHSPPRIICLLQRVQAMWRCNFRLHLSFSGGTVYATSRCNGPMDSHSHRWHP